jgi:hypothetical protein
MINLFADVDISVVCEEVVEGVFAGHVFQNVTAQSFDMVPSSQGRMSEKKSGAPTPTSTTQSSLNSEVAVILDVDIQNYHFTTQPGAFRRVIMNLLGKCQSCGCPLSFRFPVLKHFQKGQLARYSVSSKAL